MQDNLSLLKKITSNNCNFQHCCTQFAYLVCRLYFSHWFPSNCIVGRAKKKHCRKSNYFNRQCSIVTSLAIDSVSRDTGKLHNFNTMITIRVVCILAICIHVHVLNWIILPLLIYIVQIKMRMSTHSICSIYTMHTVVSGLR